MNWLKLWHQAQVNQFFSIARYTALMNIEQILRIGYNFTNLSSRRKRNARSRHANRIELGNIVGPSRAKQAAGWGFYLFTAVLSIWLFVYISGLFPYLGYEHRTHHYHKFSSNEGVVSSSLGPNSMFLVKGQTAFYDYDMKVTKQTSGMWLDIRPIYEIGISDNAKWIHGDQQGRWEYEVPETGVYSFKHDVNHRAFDSKVTYDVSWGAY
ncbi:hypothetical protein [Parasphingorhabdus halotolerans]|uniref:Uncharacterized protein n=1 Tax=Parasphingorhabdus halotolerans TaxID=2725558 RepID=A0A6H2DKZ2_9SPHN|nr:hypothetical protein [Parasphingorhabdus halotolerans]QJB68326.1 hypothetical protein HF685_02575 [Parasphingorhabdus halotolerans]